MLYRAIAAFVGGCLFLWVGPIMSKSSVYQPYAGPFLTVLGWVLLVLALLQFGYWMATKDKQKNNGKK